MRERARGRGAAANDLASRVDGGAIAEGVDAQGAQIDDRVRRRLGVAGGHGAGPADQEQDEWYDEGERESDPIPHDSLPKWTSHLVIRLRGSRLARRRSR